MSSLAPMYALLAEQSKMKPYEEFERDWLANRRQETINKTELIQLAELKRAQETAAAQRAFYQQHPELALGAGGMQSVLGGGGPPPGPPGGAPMMQSTVMPGQPPGQPQMIPGGQDLSQFATQGGLPMQSTLGQPGPQQAQAPPNPLLELMRSNPDAALAVQQRVQQFQEKRLDWQAKRMGYFGQVLQGANDEESYQRARQEIGRVDSQAAAGLPPTYDKEKLLPYIKQALSVKDSATLQLETMKTQSEMARLGLQGEPAAMVSELRTMGVNPLQATTEQRQQAQKNIQQRELAKEGEAQRLKFEQEQQLSSTLPLQDARKEDAGLFVYKGTGQGVPGTIPYGQIKQLQDEQDPTKGVVKLANLDEKKQLTTLKQLEPVLQQYADLVQYAYGRDPKTGKKGPMADYQRSPSDVIDAAWNQLTQDDPVFQAKRRALEGQLQSVVRGLGARGDLNEQELAAAKGMLANMEAFVGLRSGGPWITLGMQPTVKIPDSPATGVELANELIGTVNRRIGSILQHEGYAKTPTITLQNGTPPATPTTTPPTTPAPTPPAQPKGRQPGEIPVLGGPGMPEQYLPAPGQETPPPQAPAMPSTRPTPPTATSTPAQDEAYRQSQGQGTPAAPAPPAARPTPGRQSQAPTGTRLAGAPKYMELADVAEAMRQTGKSRAEVERRARELGYTVYGSKLKLPEETAIG